MDTIETLAAYSGEMDGHEHENMTPVHLFSAKRVLYGATFYLFLFYFILFFCDFGFEKIRGRVEGIRGLQIEN